MIEFNNDSHIESIRDILYERSKDSIIEDLLAAYLKYPDLLEHTVIWAEHLRRKNITNII